MNLRLIEKRFQNLETRANYLNYKYNPNCQKVSGIPQHAYMDDLKTDYMSDMKVFGQDPFHTKKVENSRLASANGKGDISLSFNSSAANMYNFDKFSGGCESPARPYTTQTLLAKKRRYQPYSSQGPGFGMPRRNIQSQQVLARRLTRDGGSGAVGMSQQIQPSTEEPQHILDQAVKRERLIKQQMQQKTLQRMKESKEQFANQQAHLRKGSKPLTFSKNINQIMESIIKFKLPEQMFEVIKQHQDPNTDNFVLSDRLSDVQSLNDLIYKKEDSSRKSPGHKNHSQSNEANLDLVTAKLDPPLPSGSKQLSGSRDPQGGHRLQSNGRHASNMRVITPQKMSPRFSSQEKNGRFLSQTFGQAHIFGQGVKSISTLLAARDCVNPNTMVLNPRVGEAGDAQNILTNEKIVLQNDLSQQTLAQQSRQMASGSGNDEVHESVRKQMRMQQSDHDGPIKIEAHAPTKTLEENSINSPVSPITDGQQQQDAHEGQTTGSLRNTRATVINTKGIAESAECTARMDGELNAVMPQSRKTTRNPNNELFQSNAINQNKIEIKNSRKAGAPIRAEKEKPGEKAAEAAGSVSAQPPSKSASAEGSAVKVPQKLTNILLPSYKNLLFNLKITDVGDLSNPFVVFEKRPINQDGVLFLHDSLMNLTKEEQKNLNINPCHIFPWLKRPQDLERRTLKIEVIYSNELILCRYLHLNKLYPVEYPKLALQISNNIYQNQYLLYKEKKVSSLLQRSSKRNQRPEKGMSEPESAIQAALNESGRQTDSQGGGNSSSRAPHIIQKAQIVEHEQILVFDGANNISIQPDECMIKVQRVQPEAQADNLGRGFLVPHYFTINPAKDRGHKLLEQLRHHKVSLKDLKSHIQDQSQHSGAALPKEALLKFPQFSKVPQKIVIEFQDSVIQGLDLMDFHILVDDNQDRIQALVDFESEQRPSLGQSYPVRGYHMNQMSRKDKTNERTHAALNSYNVVFGQEKQLNEDTQELNKQIVMAQHDKGLNVLIRKQHGKRAADNRKVVSRRPLRPNEGLVEAREFNGAICAAEMSDKGQIFKHLINTSLLTAPLFPDPQVSSQFSHLLSPIDEIFSQPASHSASAFKKMAKNPQAPNEPYQSNDPRVDGSKPERAHFEQSNTRSLQTSPEFQFCSEDKVTPEMHNITKPQYLNCLSMNRNSDISRPELAVDFGALGKEHVASFGDINVLRNNNQVQNISSNEAPGKGLAARVPGQIAELEQEAGQSQHRGDTEPLGNLRDSSHLNSTKKLATFDRMAFGSQNLQNCELNETQHVDIKTKEGLGLRVSTKKQNSETVHYMKIDGGLHGKGRSLAGNDVDEGGFERENAVQANIVAEMHESLNLNQGKQDPTSMPGAVASIKDTEQSRKSSDGHTGVERIVSIASSDMGNYKLLEKEREQALEAKTGEAQQISGTGTMKKKVSYSKELQVQPDLASISQHNASQKSNQLIAGGRMKQSGQNKQYDLATNQLNDHFNIQNAGARYSNENVRKSSQQEKGLELAGGQKESRHQLMHKPLLSGHHLNAAGLQGVHGGSLEQIQQPTTFIKVLGESGQVAYNGSAAPGAAAAQPIQHRLELSSSQLKQSILRNNSNQSGLSGPSQLAGTIHREQRSTSQLSNSVERPARQPSAEALGAHAIAGLSSNSSLSPLGPKPAPKMTSQYGGKKIKTATTNTNQPPQDADKYSPSYFASAEAMAKLKGVSDNSRK